jgi:hypothetical protein
MGNPFAVSAFIMGAGGRYEPPPDGAYPLHHRKKQR